VTAFLNAVEKEDCYAKKNERGQILFEGKLLSLCPFLILESEGIWLALQGKEVQKLIQKTWMEEWADKSNSIGEGPT
jgi:hypothetical protein